MSRIVLVAGGLLLCAACGGSSVQQQGVPVPTRSDLTETAKARLATKRIFFGHQSVGGNILDGLADLVREEPALDLRVVGLDGIPNTVGGFFAHARVGQNGHPAAKTDEFARLLDEGLASRIDIAFHKYCYVDFAENTNANAVFLHYRNTMARLRMTYPNIRLVHVTVPLVAVQTGAKSVVKRILGRAPTGYQDDFLLEEFNELMRQEYAGREPLFDLAAIESTAPDGTQESIRFNRASVRALYPLYTNDGGHLNEIGRRRLAAELIGLLAEVAASK